MAWKLLLISLVIACAVSFVQSANLAYDEPAAKALAFATAAAYADNPST